LSREMIADFHSHILPGIDDGSRNVKQSLEMLRMEARQGVARVVATPHFYPSHDSPERFLARREAAAQALRGAMAQEAGLPEIELAAEVYYFPGISDSDILSQLTIGGNQYILIEMPMPPWSEKMYAELVAVYEKQNLIPVIAHIDRYVAPLQTFRIPQRLAQLPVLVQANSSFFTQKATAGLAFRLLREEKVHLLGTDAHNLTDRAPNMKDALDAIRKKMGTEILQQIHGFELQVLGRQKTEI